MIVQIQEFFLVYTEFQSEFRKIPILTFVKPTQYKKSQSLIEKKTELSYHLILKHTLSQTNGSLKKINLSETVI